MQEHLQVYQRAGEPCLRCGRPIRRIVVGGRSTHFCRGASGCRRSSAKAAARLPRPRRRRLRADGAAGGPALDRARTARASSAGPRRTRNALGAPRPARQGGRDPPGGGPRRPGARRDRPEGPPDVDRPTRRRRPRGRRLRDPRPRRRRDRGGRSDRPRRPERRRQDDAAAPDRRASTSRTAARSTASAA